MNLTKETLASESLCRLVFVRDSYHDLGFFVGDLTYLDKRKE